MIKISQHIAEIMGETRLAMVGQSLGMTQENTTEREEQRRRSWSVVREGGSGKGRSESPHVGGFREMNFTDEQTHGQHARTPSLTISHRVRQSGS